MSDTNPQPSEPSQYSNIVGGCALAFALPFVLAGVLWPLLHALAGTLDENILMFFPLLVGLPCFIISHVLALIGIFSKVERAKRLGKTTLIAIWGSIAISVLILCLVPEPSSKSVVGTYDGSFHGLTETLELKQDGTFMQTLTLPSKDKLTASGGWELKHRALALNNDYLMFIDMEKGELLIHPQKVYSMTYLYSSGILINDWGTGHYTAARRH
jgi:cytochrome c biogenesis factor